jgi:preprotein translocase subunit SecA
MRFVKPYLRIIQVDLHTGYGERGKMHLFPNPPKTQQIRQATEELYAGYQIDWGDSKDFYTINGDFSNLFVEMFPDKQIVPMTLEFGTMDSQKTMGSLKSIQTMILENQGFHHGYRNAHTEKVVKERIREMYNPSSEVWRTLVMDQASKIFDQVKAKIK